MKVAAHRGLYDPDDEVPALCGTRCETCGATFFPPLGVGCEVCGAEPEHLSPMSIAAAGVLHSVATVHLYHGDDIAAPFAVGEIQLDAGPLIRCTLVRLLDLDAIGRRVEAHWVVANFDTEGNEVIEPRFALAEQANPAAGAS
jgi:uncharacterized OB-fold protein